MVYISVVRSRSASLTMTVIYEGFVRTSFFGATSTNPSDYVDFFDTTGLADSFVGYAFVTLAYLLATAAETDAIVRVNVVVP